MLSHEVRKVNKFSHTELFGAARQQGLSQKLCMIRSSPFAALVEFGQQRLDRATHHFTSLIESGFHHAAQQILVAAGVFHLVARHAHHRASHLGRRIEYPRFNRKQVVDLVIQLHQHTQYAVGLASRRSRQTLSHLFLNHARAARNEVAVIEHFKENLATDVVRIIARQNERPSLESMLQMHFQKIVFDNVIFQ